jgi:hypothetical protein
MCAELSHAMIRMKPVAGVSFIAGLYRKAKALEPAKKLERPINTNIGAPYPATSVTPNANKARFVSNGNGKIATVFLPSNVAQVGNPIVGSDAVDVVDLPPWRHAVDPLPYNPMGGQLLPSNLAFIVSVAVDACKSGAACISRVKHAAFLLRRSNPSVKVFWEGIIPSEASRYWAIVKKLSNGAYGHDSLQWLTPERNTYKRGVQHVR